MPVMPRSIVQQPQGGQSSNLEDDGNRCSSNFRNKSWNFSPDRCGENAVSVDTRKCDWGVAKDGNEGTNKQMNRPKVSMESSLNSRCDCKRGRMGYR
jgi:hypothetical protein